MGCTPQAKSFLAFFLEGRRRRGAAREPQSKRPKIQRALSRGLSHGAVHLAMEGNEDFFHKALWGPKIYGVRKFLEGSTASVRGPYGTRNCHRAIPLLGTGTSPISAPHIQPIRKNTESLRRGEKASRVPLTARWHALSMPSPGLTSPPSWGCPSTRPHTRSYSCPGRQPHWGGRSCTPGSQ